MQNLLGTLWRKSLHWVGKWPLGPLLPLCGPGPQFLHMQQVGLALGDMGDIFPLWHSMFLLEGGKAGGKAERGGVGRGRVGVVRERRQNGELWELLPGSSSSLLRAELNEWVLGTGHALEVGAGGRWWQHGVVAVSTDSRAVLSNRAIKEARCVILSNLGTTLRSKKKNAVKWVLIIYFIKLRLQYYYVNM